MMRAVGGRELPIVSLLFALAGCGGEDSDLGEIGVEIVGGSTTPVGSFAATGALLYGGRFRCTATLIGPAVAITAAHCLNDDGFGEFGFTLESNVSRGVSGSAITPVHAVRKHPGYIAGGTRLGIANVNDVGLVLLASPINHVQIERLDGPARSRARRGRSWRR
jgi:hypothetical protein